MDDNTKTNIANERTRLAMNDFAKKFQMSVFETPQEKGRKDEASWDGGIMEHQPSMPSLAGIVEAKVRWVRPEVLANDWDNEWMMDESKVEINRKIAMNSNVPFFGMLIFGDIDEYLWIEISNRKGWIQCPIRYGTQKTQASTAGGQKMADLAYIKMDNAKRYKIGESR